MKTKRCTHCNRKLHVSAFEDVQNHGYCKQCHAKMDKKVLCDRRRKDEEKLEKKLNIAMLEKYTML